MIMCSDHGSRGPPNTRDTRGPDITTLMFSVCGKGQWWHFQRKSVLAVLWTHDHFPNRFIYTEVPEESATTAQGPTS